MSDQPAWGTPSREPPDRRSSTRSDARREEDDRLDDLYASVVDTPGSGGTAPSGRGRIVVAVVAVLVVCGVVGWLFLRSGSTGSPVSGSAVTEAVATDEVWSAVRAPRVVDDLVEVAGGTQFVQVQLRAEYASGVAPTKPDATTTDRYSWRDGKAERGDPEGLLDADDLFDVTTVDWAAVEGLVAQASDLSGIDGRPNVVYVERAVDGGASAAAKMSLHMSDDYGRSANITADEKGQIVWMESDIEGSPAFEWEAAGLFQPERTRQAIADLVAVAGSTQFVSVRLYGHHASAYALVAPEDSTTHCLSWSDGFASAKSTTIPVRPATLFDITTVDWSPVPGLIVQARELTGVDDPVPSVSAEVSRDGSGVVFEIYLDDDSDVSGTVVFDMAGQVVSMRGGAPGSASKQWEATH